MLRHLTFGPRKAQRKIAILLPEKDLRQSQIEKHYVQPLEAAGINKNDILVLSLQHNSKNRAPVSMIRPWLESLEKVIRKQNISHVLVCDSAYFKVLAKVTKVEPHYGYGLPAIWEGVTVFASINYSQLLFNPDLKKRLNLSISALQRNLQGKNGLFSANVLKRTSYLFKPMDIMNRLHTLLSVPALTIDVETKGFRPGADSVRSIAFGEDEHTATAFPVTPRIHTILRNFFMLYPGYKIFHNATFDTKMLIRQLFMKDWEDIDGMLQGLEFMYNSKLHDTKIMAYLCTNSTTGNSLSLKDLAFEHTGNYAMDEIHDVDRIPLEELLEYNATDTVATWYVYNRFIREITQKYSKPYYDLFVPALKVITQMELTGAPVNMDTVNQVEKKLTAIRDQHLQAVLDHPLIAMFTNVLRDDAAEQANKRLKKLRKTRDDFPDLQFNPGSPKQMRMLLFEYLNLPPQYKTDSGLHSTDSKVMERLLVHAKDPDVIDLLEHIRELGEVEKIISTFIPALLSATPKGGWHYLMGNFNLGGTKSGRLSSSNPNLQQIPSTGTKYAKDIKRCFEAPPHVLGQNWIMVGADFSSLEDRISALQTKDENKLKVYMGHELFRITINGKTHHVRDDHIIRYDGKEMTAKNFYETYSQFRK